MLKGCRYSSPRGGDFLLTKMPAGIGYSNPAQDPAVMQALRRRGIGADAPQLSQVSSGAPMQNPVPQPMNPSDLQGSSTPPAQPNAPSQKYQPTDKEGMVLSALAEFLKNNQNLEKEKLKLVQGRVPSPASALPSIPSSEGLGFASEPVATANQQDPINTPLV